MKHEEKKPKVGPREQQLREMREARVERNKVIIEKNVKAMNKAFNVKDQPHKTKTRVKKTVTVKRGRSGR